MDPSVVKPFPQWWLDWHYSLRSKPWRIVVSNISYEEENARFDTGHVNPKDHRCIVDEPLKQSDPFSIWLYPSGENREEFPFCLIYEKLTAETAHQLTTASLVIKDALQVDTIESLYAMIQIFVAFEVWMSGQAGKSSVLTFGVANLDDTPGYQLQNFLWFWNTMGAGHIANLRSLKEAASNNHSAQVFYATIPPRIVADSSSPAIEEEGRVKQDDDSSLRTIFQQKGEHWSILYDSKSTSLNNSKGLQYIAYLLERPGESIPVTILRAVTEKQNFDYQQIEPSADENLSYQNQSDVENKSDEKARAAYHQRLKEISEERTEAEEVGNTERLTQLDSETQQIENELQSIVGRGGRLRKTANPMVERDRKAVYSRLQDAYKKIKKSHSSLHSHLCKYIATEEHQYCYNPPQPPSWEF